MKIEWRKAQIAFNFDKADAQWYNLTQYSTKHRLRLDCTEYTIKQGDFEMNLVMQRLERFFAETPDKMMLKYTGDGRTLTYRDVDELSGRVYRYLHEAGIGREQSVLINLPRGVDILAVIIGIWKAGAACIVCEDNMAVERVRFIAADSGTNLVITKENLDELYAAEPLAGRAKVDPHDACYVVYTSGTTGNPKGVIHEFGNLEESVRAKDIDGGHMYRQDDVLALNSPLNFVASMDHFDNAIAAGGSVVLMAMEHVKNPAMLTKLYAENHVTVSFMTPSLFRSCGELPDTVRKITLGGEPCLNLYSEGVALYNAYNMSEAGRDIGVFPVKQPYPVTPVGPNHGGETILILREDGTEAPAGEAGEICFANPFVRGYIGLPEKTAQAWRNGLFHTGDIGVMDENRILTLQGRNDDMIKINGNRIEPSEIENVAKRVFSLNWACAKGFVTEKSAFVVLYTTEKLPVTPDEARETLKKYLTSYMIPSYFVQIDEVPMLPNGKLNKKALLAPDINSFRKAYEPPKTAEEKEMVAAFEKVLELTDIGVNDDFYELGGDSLRSMELLTTLDWPDFSVADVFRGRTPRKIVQLYLESAKQNVSAEEQNREALGKTFPLTPYQLHMLDYQLYSPASTMLNIHTFLKFAPHIDMEKMARSLNTVIMLHPSLMTRLYVDEFGEFVQQYDPALFEEIPLEHFSEAELIDIREGLIRPFKLTNQRLYRMRLFQTERGGYLFLDIHHMISDGTSLRVFLDSLMQVYAGQTPAPDYYWAFLAQQSEAKFTAYYQQCREYFSELYDNRTWNAIPTADFADRENSMAAVESDIPIEPAAFEQISARFGLNKNAFFVCCALLALREYNRRDDCLLTVTFNGRQSETDLNIVGLLLKDLTVGVSFGELRTVSELCRCVRERLQESIAHDVYPYSMMNESLVDDDKLCVLYQLNIYNVDSGAGEQPAFAIVDIPNPYQAAENAFNVEIVEQNGQLSLAFEYMENRYRRENVERFRRMFQKAALTLARYAMEQRDGALDEAFPCEE